MKRSVPLLSALALAGLLLAPLGLLAVPQAAAKSRTVTKTFSSTAAVTIPDSGEASPYPAVINVSFARYKLKRVKVLDVNLTLVSLSHTYPQDLDVLLVAPNGGNAIVMSDATGNIEISGLTLTLDDEAAAPLPLGEPYEPETALGPGSFQPANYSPQWDDAPDGFGSAPAPSGAVALSTFDGSNPNGRWKLFVFDDNEQDGGSLAGWKLTIQVTGIERR